MTKDLASLFKKDGVEIKIANSKEFIEAIAANIKFQAQ